MFKTEVIDTVDQQKSPGAVRDRRLLEERFLTIEVIRDKWRLERVRNEWSRLVERTDAGIFQTFEWTQLWWKHFGENNTLHILLFRHHGTLVGVAPLFIDQKKKRYLGVRYTRMRLAGGGVDHEESIGRSSACGPVDYLDIIALPEYETAVVRSLVKYLLEHIRLYDEVFLEEVPSDSMIMRRLLPTLDEVGWNYTATPSDVCPRLHLPESVEVFMSSLNDKLRYELQQTRRAVTHQRLFSVHRVDRNESLDRIFPTMVGLLQKRWNLRTKRGPFPDKRFRNFLRELLESFHRRGWLWLQTANKGDQCIAVQCAITFKKMMYDYINVIDENSPLAKRGPGSALLLFLIEHAIQNDFATVDFLNGNGPIGTEVTAEGRRTWFIRIGNPRKSIPIRKALYHVQLSISSFRHRMVEKALGYFGHHRTYTKSLSKNGQLQRQRASDDDALVLPSETKDEERLNCQVINIESDFLSLRREWEELVDAAPVRIYQTFDWQWLWWKHFGASGQCTMHIVVFRHGHTLVGVAPLCIEELSVFGFRLNRKLRLMGSDVCSSRFLGCMAVGGPSDYLDILALPGFEQQVAEHLTDHLRKHTLLYDEIDFDHVPQDGLFMTKVLPELKKKGFRCFLRRGDVCPYLVVPDTIDQYARALQPSVRRRFQHARKNFSHKASRSIEAVSSPAMLESAFSDLVNLHQHRWNSLGYLGLFSDSRFLEFQDETAKAFLKRGWLWFKVASMDGVRVGARLGFQFKDRMYDYLSGFEVRDPWSKAKPGLALLLSMVEDAIESKKVVDFLRGGEQFKFELTSDLAYNWDISARSPDSGAKLLRGTSYLAERGLHLLHRLKRELLIMNIHYRVHGVSRFLFKYVGFIMTRIKNKVESAARRTLDGYKVAGLPASLKTAVSEQVRSKRPLEKWHTGASPHLQEVSENKAPPESLKEYQKRVDSHFQTTASYWKKVYEEENIDGVIYQLRSAAILALIDELRLPRGARILEVGCGAGVTAVKLAQSGFLVEAIDTIDPMIDLTRSRAVEAGVDRQVIVSKADAHSLEFHDCSFDVVLAIGVTPWLYAPEQAMREMQRVLKSGGSLIITADNSHRLNHLLDPRLHPALAPLRERVKQVLQRMHLRKKSPNVVLARMFSIREFDRLIQSAGLEKKLGFTFGFGPFSIFGKQLFPEIVSKVLHHFLQHLVWRDIPLIRTTGSQYAVLAHKAT